MGKIGIVKEKSVISTLWDILVATDKSDEELNSIDIPKKELKELLDSSKEIESLEDKYGIVPKTIKEVKKTSKTKKPSIKINEIETKTNIKEIVEDKER